MAWFQHEEDATEDPFMQHLQHHFRNDGYAVFFKILELMTQNFDPYAVGKLKTNWKQMRFKVGLKSKRLKQILDFINKKRKMEIEYDDDEIYIYCPKYERLMSPYAHRLLRQVVRTKNDSCTHTKNNMYGKNRIDKKEEEGYVQRKNRGIFHIKDVLKKLKLWEKKEK